MDISVINETPGKTKIISIRLQLNDFAEKYNKYLRKNIDKFHMLPKKQVDNMIKNSPISYKEYKYSELKSGQLKNDQSLHLSCPTQSVSDLLESLKKANGRKTFEEQFAD